MSATGNRVTEAPIKFRLPSRLEVHLAHAKDPTTITGHRWDAEVHGYVLDIENDQPTRIRTCGVFAEKPTKEDVLGLLQAWFEHEMREQLGMDPHGTSVVAKPVCSACDDTHVVHNEERGTSQMCTRCPVPCPKCRRALSAYCDTTPCSCVCHWGTR